MSEPLDLGHQAGTKDAPVARFVQLILFTAIKNRADEILFELDCETEARFEAKKEELIERGRMEEARSGILPNTFGISFLVTGCRHQLAPAPGSLFEPAARLLLNAAEIPYWKKGEVSGEIETCNPTTRWTLSSPDTSRSIRLERVNNAAGGLPKQQQPT